MNEINTTFTQKLSKWNDHNWKKWESSWSKVYAKYDSNSAKISALVQRLSAWDNKNCENIIASCFPNQYYCNNCCEYSHSYSYDTKIKNGALVHGHLHQHGHEPNQTLVEKFVKFDGEKFEPKPEPETVINDVKHKIIEHAKSKSAVEKFVDWFKMNKTEQQYFDELYNEMAWIKSGASVREVFNMDKDDS